ncbi:hypothetical protein ACCS79_03580 [Rhizobium johnstonii]|uniref:hypothetical protein n=1 Tax=Rhizobium johnstonii TaxID=3019933 RepID=UPI003F9A1EBC
MPAAIFVDMNDLLRDVFAHETPVIWHRAGGPAEGHALKAWFTSVSEEVDADGFRTQTGKPQLTVFVGDILAIDPSRAAFREEEILSNDGTDTFTVDGVRRRVECCKSDGYRKVIVDLTR